VLDLHDILENYARNSYEKVRVLQPQLQVNGLYKKGLEYFIVCDSLDVEVFGESTASIVEFFNNKIRVAGSSVQLVTHIPEGAVQVKEERTIEEMITLAGEPLTSIELNKQISLLLPRDFPKIWIKFNGEFERWDVYSERTLNQTEKEIVIKKLEIILNSKVQVEFFVDTNIQRYFPNKTHDPLSILVSKHSTHNFSKALMNKWEEDEQLWSDNKQKLFTTSEEDEGVNEDRIPSSSCLINGQSGDPHNIRNYLTLFDEVQIVMPIESSYEKFINSLGIQEDELLELLEINKVKLIFPHSIQRYNKSLVEKAASFNPNGIMLTRELAYKTVLDLRHRNPLVFLPTNIQEKHEILSNLMLLSSESRGEFERKWIEGLTYELSNTWNSMYQLLSIRGAIGTYNVGLGPTINSMIKQASGNDYMLENMHACHSIEWAAANNAVLCPIGHLAQHEERLAYLYSGVREGWNLEIETSPNIATGEILTIAQHVPVIELAKSFTGSEIRRFRQLVVDITRNKSNEEIQIAIEEFNDSVKRYERNQSRTDSWDLKGITLDASLEMANAAIPFAGFVTKQLGRLIGFGAERYTGLDKVVNQVQSKVYGTSPNVILVSKMRNKMKDLL